MQPAKLLKWLSLYSLFLAAFFLPLKTSISNAGIIALLLLSGTSCILLGSRTQLLKSPYFYLATTLALYIPIVAGTLYAPSLNEAFFHWKKSIFYLLVPILTLRKDLYQKDLLVWSSWGLVLGSVISMLVILFMNLYAFMLSGLPLEKLLGYDYTGKSFLRPLGELHPVYYGSYLLLMLVLLWSKTLSWRFGIKGLITALALLVLIFLNSRIIFFIGGLILIILLFKRLSPVKAGLIIMGIVLTLLLAQPFLKQTYLYNKLLQGTAWELTDNISTPNTDLDNRADSRMSRWKVSLEIFWEKPLFGHGTGTARGLLLHEYQDRNMVASLQQEYDSHNQYLGFAIEYGAIGLLFIVAFFGSNIYLALKGFNTQRFIFYVMIAVICLSENYLIRNMGINCVALFAALFYLNEND